ncbi:hypothetical protein BYT27DRAFT_7264130 [Phlegmacium glaucopus]|nr:hypothetical protein BYT27DRAFT_7264130 [Phlegmacium glaucopus]
MGAMNNTGAGGAGPRQKPPNGVSSTEEDETPSFGFSKIRHKRRGKEDLSEYQVPAIESTTPGGSAIPTVIPAPAPASTSAVPVQTAVSTSAASTSAQAIATPATAETCRRGYGGNIKKVRKRKVYDDDSDVHRVSSRPETD